MYASFVLLVRHQRASVIIAPLYVIDASLSFVVVGTRNVEPITKFLIRHSNYIEVNYLEDCVGETQTKTHTFCYSGKRNHAIVCSPVLSPLP